MQNISKIGQLLFLINFVCPNFLLLIIANFKRGIGDKRPLASLRFDGGVQQCRSTTVPKKAGKFQNNLRAFSKEREIIDANYQRKHTNFGAKMSATAN